MNVKVKICGLSTPESVAEAVADGADFVGFVFYPPSPRNVTPEEAQALAGAVPAGVARVALTVDADDALIDAIVAAIRPDYIQAHGSETPERIAAIRERAGVPVIKAIKLREAGDLDQAAPYEGIADMLLFDARAPEGATGALPGGNGVAFDWSLLADYRPGTGFMLSGGLDPENVAKAVAVTGAAIVDVSSGVETAPGVKDLGKIRRFLSVAKAL